MPETLGDLFDLVRGTTYKSALLGKPGPVLLGLASIDRNGGFRDANLKTYGGESPSKLLVKPGELYLSLKDVTQSADLLGAVARLPEDHPQGRLTQDTVRLVPKKEGINLAYVYWMLRTPQYRSYCKSHATGTTNLGLARDDFLAFEIPRLTPERKKLVSILDKIENKIALNQRMAATLEEMARAIFKSWFIDFDPVRAKAEGRPTNLPPEIDALFPDAFEDSDLGQIPSGWRTGSIAEIALVGGGSTPSTKNPEYWDGAFAWATPKDLSKLDHPVLLSTERSITEAGLKAISSGMYPPGTVLMSSRAPIGYLAISELPIAVNQGFIALQSQLKNGNLFLFRWLEANIDAVHGRANGSTFMEISKSAFRSIETVLPSNEIMQEFGTLTYPLRRRLVEAIKESIKLTTIRDTLLPKLMNEQ